MLFCTLWSIYYSLIYIKNTLLCWQYTTHVPTVCTTRSICACM